MQDVLACLGALAIGLGETTNYMAESEAIISGLEWALDWAVRWMVDTVVVASDSHSVVLALRSGKVPWRVMGRWRRVQ